MPVAKRGEEPPLPIHAGLQRDEARGTGVLTIPGNTIFRRRREQMRHQAAGGSEQKFQLWPGFRSLGHIHSQRKQ